jgi:hypothetical protein
MQLGQDALEGARQKLNRVAVICGVSSSKTLGTERLRHRVGTGSALRRQRLQCAGPVLFAYQPGAPI